MAAADLAREKFGESVKRALVGKLQTVVSQGAWTLLSIQQDGVIDGSRTRLEGRDIIKYPFNDGC